MVNIPTPPKKNANEFLSKEELLQKDYYDCIADKYDQYQINSPSIKYRSSIYDYFFSNINLKGLRILGAMCGSGEATNYFLRFGSFVTGLDISEGCCLLYKKRFEECEVLCGSILDSGFDDGYFDIIVTDSLHHLHPYLKQGMNEINRILKPNGYFFCWEPHSGSLLDIIRKLWYRIDRDYFQENESSIDINRLIKDQKNNLKQKKIIYGGNFAYLFVMQGMALRIPIKIINLYSKFFMALEKCLNRLNNRFISCWAGVHFIKCDK